MNALGGVFGPAESSAGFLAQFHQQSGQLPRVVGLLLKRVSIPKAFPFKINGVDLMAAESYVPVIAENTLKDLLFEQFQRSVIKLEGREDTVSIQPGLKPGIDAVEIKKRFPLIDVKNVYMIDDVHKPRQNFRYAGG
jgi:hypothetical protein